MTKQEAVALSGARSSMYRFLGGIYLKEVDKEQLKALKKLEFPEIKGDDDADMDLREGYEYLKSAVCNLTEDDLDELASDYARVFLAAGSATGNAAFPYESVYVDSRRQTGGSTAMKLKALLLERGLEPDPSKYKTMYDDIGIIFEYAGVLCSELKDAIVADDKEKADSLILEQKNFLKSHITNWVFSFTSDIVKFTEQDLYRGIARITSGFIRKEAQLLKGGMEWDIV